MEGVRPPAAAPASGARTRTGHAAGNRGRVAHGGSPCLPSPTVDRKGACSTSSSRSSRSSRFFSVFLGLGRGQKGGRFQATLRLRKKSTCRGGGWVSGAHRLAHAGRGGAGTVRAVVSRRGIERGDEPSSQATGPDTARNPAGRARGRIRRPATGEGRPRAPHPPSATARRDLRQPRRRPPPSAAFGRPRRTTCVVGQSPVFGRTPGRPRFLKSPWRRRGPLVSQSNGEHPSVRTRRARRQFLSEGGSGPPVDVPAGAKYGGIAGRRP